MPTVTSRSAIVLVLTVATVGAHGRLAAQSSEPFKMDFTVPDAPAFELLRPSKNVILRPGNVRELTVGIAEAIQPDGSITMPLDFGVEVSPALLLKGETLSRQDYKDNAFLYRLRVSMATRRSETTSDVGSFAFGVRMTFRDDGDLRTNTLGDSLAVRATAAAAELNERRQAVQDSLQAALNLGPMEAAEMANELVSSQEAEAFIDSALKALEKRLWNQDQIDFALAIRADPTQPGARDLDISALASWFTAGFGFGNWGQLLTGVRASMERPAAGGDLEAQGALSSRLYFGGNRAKVFVELGADIAEGDSARALFNAGGDFRLATGGWITFSVGVESGGDAPEGVVADLGLNVSVLDLFGG